MKRRTVGILTFQLFVLFAVSHLALPSESAASEEGEHDVELADYMSRVQYFAFKLGFAVQANNQALAVFYTEELEEVLEKVMKIEEYEGIPIGAKAKEIIEPLVEELERVVAGGEKQKVQAAYDKLLNGCNACHAATEHGYIKIAPNFSTNPFLQDFKP
ncbi:MAG: hypothetical protein KDD69_00145 [Bdellovibrionales bacterium]|nr:hypothetical protein [Bdellovibrionales bacterium]